MAIPSGKRSTRVWPVVGIGEYTVTKGSWRATVVHVKCPGFKMAATDQKNVNTLFVLKVISYEFTTPGLNHH